ncbi:ABC transporter permease [Ignatzschineria sp. LJL83]
MIHFRFNDRIRTALWFAIALVLILSMLIASHYFNEVGIRANFAIREQAPSWQHWFGTDSLGRDMFARTLHGLTLSLKIGVLSALISVFFALFIVLFSGINKVADSITNFVIDAALSIPHLILLVLICFALGGGTEAVIIAISVSLWPRFARILRAELIQVHAEQWIEASQGFGKSRLFILFKHILPHLIPQILVGLLLMFPHAILHEASLTFLGFGLEPSRPAIGIMLSEAMRHLSSGKWWLGIFPGLALLFMVLCFDILANSIRRLTNPKEAQN